MAVGTVGPGSGSNALPEIQKALGVETKPTEPEKPEPPNTVKNAEAAQAVPGNPQDATSGIGRNINIFA